MSSASRLPLQSRSGSTAVDQSSSAVPGTRLVDDDETISCVSSSFIKKKSSFKKKLTAEVFGQKQTNELSDNLENQPVAPRPALLEQKQCSSNRSLPSSTAPLAPRKMGQRIAKGMKKRILSWKRDKSSTDINESTASEHELRPLKTSHQATGATKEESCLEQGPPPQQTNIPIEPSEDGVDDKKENEMDQNTVAQIKDKVRVRQPMENVTPARTPAPKAQCSKKKKRVTRAAEAAARTKELMEMTSKESELVIVPSNGMVMPQKNPSFDDEKDATIQKQDAASIFRPKDKHSKRIHNQESTTLDKLVEQLNCKEKELTTGQTRSSASSAKESPSEEKAKPVTDQATPTLTREECPSDEKNIQESSNEQISNNNKEERGEAEPDSGGVYDRDEFVHSLPPIVAKRLHTGLKTNVVMVDRTALRNREPSTNDSSPMFKNEISIVPTISPIVTQRSQDSIFSSTSSSERGGEMFSVPEAPARKRSTKNERNHRYSHHRHQSNLSSAPSREDRSCVSSNDAQSTDEEEDPIISPTGSMSSSSLSFDPSSGMGGEAVTSIVSSVFTTRTMLEFRRRVADCIAPVEMPLSPQSVHYSVNVPPPFQRGRPVERKQRKR